MFAEALLASLIATNSTWVDMGQLYNDYVVNECVNYYSVPANIEQKKLDEKLSAMFRSFKTNATKFLTLSYAQLSDIEQLHTEKGTTKLTNPFSTMLAPGYLAGPYTVGSTNQHFLQYFSEFAKKSGIQLILSFGGPNATRDDMKIGAEAVGQLRSFMKKHNFAGIDLDLRGEALKGLFEKNNEQTVISFLKQMRNVTLTTDGNFNEGTRGILKPLFARFDELFSGINLMLFKETKHRLGKNDMVYGLHRWANIIKPHKIHVGFDTKIDYHNTSSVEGTPYKLLAGLKKGQAAAHLIKKSNSVLGKPLGTPVFFSDDSLNLEKNTFIRDCEALLKK